jgi:hypothetical protein
VRGDHASSIGLLPTAAQPVNEMGARAGLRKLITAIAIIANSNHVAGGVANPLGTELRDQEKQKCDAHHFSLIASHST